MGAVERLRPHGSLDPQIIVIFSIALIFMLFAQCLVCAWRKQHSRSYQMVTLLFLWVVPPVLALQFHHWQLLSLWCVFSGITGWIIYESTRRPLHPSTPRLVYGWFVALYRLCMCLGCVGYFVFMVNILFSLGGDEASFTSIGCMLLLYGLYFGVMGRDFAEVCTDCMASRIGFASSRKERGRVKAMPPNTCAICSQQLDDIDLDLKRAVTLPCKHSYHEYCLRGWTIVGKKDTCPYCMEKVDLRRVFCSPWESQSYMWARVLDALRYLVLWHPLIIIFTQMAFHIVRHMSVRQL